MADVFESTFFRLMISEDNMRADMMLLEPEEGWSITLEMALDFLLEKGIRMGVDQEKLNKMIESKTYSEPFTVAVGKPALSGKNGWFEFFFDTNVEAKPQENEDGSVDFYNMKLFEEVAIGDKLVTYHPATKGEFGFDIKGKFLMPKNGKELAKIKGKGFSISEDGLTYTAEMCGKIEYRYGEITILEVFEVPGDLDLTVGNVRFSGDVKVRGDVTGGMLIDASGNVEIQGHVAGATIKAGKDIILKKGVQGAQEAHIEAKGNIFGQFFEEATIVCGGNLEGNYLLNCNTYAVGKVNIRGKHGRIMGGKTHGILGIEMHDGGNDNEIATILQVGISDEIMEQYSNITEEIKKNEEEVQSIENGISKLTMYKDTFYPEEYEKNRIRMLQTKIVKNAEKTKNMEKHKELFQIINQAHVAYIGVHDCMHVGVQLFFEGHTKKITSNYYNSMFKVMDGSVGVLPLDL
ncbi:MAG: FapA family protein [Alistipes sp.]|nr:FapA family protein [Alistipes sp.]